MALKRKYLFGGDKLWNSADWTASDDRVRGGKSQSYLDCSSTSAEFHGNLDIKTLGGAGFASQRTTGEDRTWDLSSYDGVEVEIEKADEKRYTFVLKDEILPRNPENGREQSTISYEFDFRVKPHSESDKTVLFIPWEDLSATYRGREKNDAPGINLKEVKRLSIMMRSFFGDQEGPFSLSIKSISVVRKQAGEDGSKSATTNQIFSELSKMEDGHHSGETRISEVANTRSVRLTRFRSVMLIGGVILLLLASFRRGC